MGLSLKFDLYVNNFYDTTPKAWSIKEQINKLYFTKIKNFPSLKKKKNCHENERASFKPGENTCKLSI